MDIEKLIGGRWYALLGALVVIIGIGLFVRFAWQQGWVKAIPGGVRCLMAALLGVALLGAAAFARRRVNAWAAVGLNAAGLGAIYVAVYAAYALYNLFGAPLAGLLLVGCTALGVAIGVVGRLMPVAAVALIGGYLAPFLVTTDGGNAWVLPPYWLMLLATGLALAGWRGGWFVLLRWLTWSATILLGLGWTLAVGTTYPFIALSFLGLAWAMTHAELWWSCGRVEESVGAVSQRDLWRELLTMELRLPRAAGSTPGARPAAPLRAATAWTAWSPMLMSFIVTAWAVALGVLVARWSGSVPRWLPAAACAAAALMVAFPMVGHLRVLRDPVQGASERLGAALWLQAGGLVIAAVALGVSGWTQVIVWVAMGTAAVAAGRWATARPVAAFGLVVLAIAVLRVMTWELFVSGVRRVGVDLLGIHWTQWAALAGLTAMGCGVSAWLLVRDWSAAAIEHLEPVPASEAAMLARLDAARAHFGPQWRRLAIVLVSIAVLLAMLAFGHEQSAPLAVVIAWALLAVAVVSLRRLMPGLATPLVVVAMAVVAASIALMFVGEAWRQTFHAPDTTLVLAKIAGLRFDAWSGMAFVNAAACAFVAFVTLRLAGAVGAVREASTGSPTPAVPSANRREAWRRTAIVAAAVATGLTMLAVSSGGDAGAQGSARVDGLPGLSAMVLWLALAVGLTFLRRIAPTIATALLLIGLAVVAVSAARALFLAPFTSTARAVGIDVAGLRLSMWSAMNLLNAAACVYFALRMLEMSRAASGAGAVDGASDGDARQATNQHWRLGAMIMAAVATVLLSVGVFGDNEIGPAEVVAFMVLAALLALAHRFVPLMRPLRPDVHALFVVAVAVLAWFGVFVFGGWERFGDPAVLHRGLGLAIVLSAEVAWLAQSARLRPTKLVEPTDGPSTESVDSRPSWPTMLRRLIPDPATLPSFKEPLDADGLVRAGGILVPLILLLTASSLEVARVARSIAADATVRGAAVSVWWGALAIGLLVLGFHRRNALCRRIGLGLLAAATLKALFLDTASVSGGWRAVSLVGLGLLMLGVGVAYSRLSKREAESEQVPDDASPPAP